MLTHMSIKLIQWIEHHKSIIVGLAMLDRKATTYYSRLVIEVCLRLWFPIINENTFVDYSKPQLV